MLSSLVCAFLFIGTYISFSIWEFKPYYFSNIFSYPMVLLRSLIFIYCVSDLYISVFSVVTCTDSSVFSFCYISWRFSCWLYLKKSLVTSVFLVGLTQYLCLDIHKWGSEALTVAMWWKTFVSVIYFTKYVHTRIASVSRENIKWVTWKKLRQYLLFCILR
jgi:hypothetical protein